MFSKTVQFRGEVRLRRNGDTVEVQRFPNLQAARNWAFVAGRGEGYFTVVFAEVDNGFDVVIPDDWGMDDYED